MRRIDEIVRRLATLDLAYLMLEPDLPKEPERFFERHSASGIQPPGALRCTEPVDRSLLRSTVCDRVRPRDVRDDRDAAAFDIESPCVLPLGLHDEVLHEP